MKTIKPIFLILLMLATIPLYAESAESNLTPIKDSLITTAIKAKIAIDSSVSVFKIMVTTDHSNVTLAGTVNTKSDIPDLIKLAASTDGVKSVNPSELKVKASKHPLKDILIAGKVEALLWKEKFFGQDPDSLKNIHVETNDGVVYLIGTTKTQKDADDAKKLVQSISSIDQVESRITVSPTT